jgi:hypothetical protein
MGWEQYVWLFALYVFVLFTLWGFYMPYVVIFIRICSIFLLEFFCSMRYTY